MTNNDKGQFIGIMRTLHYCFPREALSLGSCDNTLAAYFEALVEFHLDDIRLAAKQYVRVGTRFPYVADLVRLIEGNKKPDPQFKGLS